LAKKHFKTTEKTYSKSVNKNDVLTILEPIYLGKEWTSISQLNQHLIITISRYIGISTEFKNSVDSDLKGHRVKRLINLINQLEGTEYISGPAAKNYLTENELQFEQNHIQLMYKEYGPYLSYDNKKNEFEDALSILDLLMNVRKEDYLKYIKSQIK
jgi:hypothetical protein